MCGAVWCLLFLLLCRGSLEMVVEDQASQSRWHTYELEKGQNILKNFKRHSDGTFTSDFTRYLDKIKAKDFVQWLARTKHEGCSDPPQIEVVRVEPEATQYHKTGLVTN